MDRKWFLINSLGGITIDLSLVTEVNWNCVSDKGIYATSFCLGTSVAYSSDDRLIMSNQRYIFNATDRKNLQVALADLGLPTVELRFNH